MTAKDTRDARNAKGARDGLAEYRRRRDFSKTAEPRGGRKKAAGDPRFVVQLHDASTRHFDFRLEVDGVLKSWAVPKGPSTDPGDKRLAMPTEDHPLDYKDFEGVIADGGYGAGTVIIWDEGTYHSDTPLAEALAKGHASFRLDGSKLHGDYALTRFREADDEAWLLVKRADSHTAKRGGRGTPDASRARSVRSGRTLKQLARDAGS